MRALRAAAIAAAIGVCVHAQTAPDKPLTFEVVSIKPAAGGPPGFLMASNFNIQAGGRFRGSFMTPMGLITQAFKVKAGQVVGAPEWIATSQYQIVGTLGGYTSGPDVFTRIPQLLRSLLADRFKLKAHVERRPFPVYALVKARRDGRLGPQLRPSVTDGQASGPCSGGVSRAGTVTAGSCTMANLVGRLTQFTMDRIVVDRTGLDGKFDVDLQWSPDQTSDGLSLFTAIQEQLGLKLEPSTEPLDAVIVEHIERPEPN